MKYRHANARVFALLTLVLLMLMMGSIKLARVVAGQETDKSLDIERFGNEPLELVELMLGDQPIKGEIKKKFRQNNVGQDTVRFKEKEDWFRRLQIRLRNVSGRTIVGVHAQLLFHAPTYRRTQFSLTLSNSTQMKQGVLQPGAEITLAVTDEALRVTAATMEQYGVSSDQASVSFEVDLVRFTDDLQWRKGSLLRRDPANPTIWILVDKEVLDRLDPSSLNSQSMSSVRPTNR